MTQSLTIPQGERGVIRVFSLDMPPEQAMFIADEPGALEQILGNVVLDRSQVEVFSVADLEGLGLYGYLRDGYGVPIDRLDPHQNALENLSGYVLVIRSRAFSGEQTRLTPADVVRLSVQVSETATDWTQEPLDSHSAQLFSAPSQRQDLSGSKSRSGLIIFVLILLPLAILTIFLIMGDS